MAVLREARLVIERDAPRPRGHLIVEDTRVEFEGWLELLCALEAALDPDPERPLTDPSRR